MGEVVDFVVEYLAPPYADAQWPMIERELDKVPHIWQGRWTKDTLLTAILHQRMQLWVAGKDGVYHVVVFTQIALFPEGNILEVVLAFGNNFLEALPTLEATLDKFAQSQNCVQIDVIGRGGFERLLAPYGFKRSSVVVSRAVKRAGVH